METRLRRQFDVFMMLRKQLQFEEYTSVQGRQNVFESRGAKVCENVFAPQGSSSVP